MCAAPMKVRSHSSDDKSIDYDFNKLKKTSRILKKLKKKKLKVKKKLSKLKTKNLYCQKRVLTRVIDFIKLAKIIGFLISIKKIAFKFGTTKNMKEIFFKFTEKLSAVYITLDNYRHDVQKMIDSHKYNAQKKARKEDIKTRIEKRDKIARRRRDHGDDSSYFRLDRG